MKLKKLHVLSVKIPNGQSLATSTYLEGVWGSRLKVRSHKNFDRTGKIPQILFAPEKTELIHSPSFLQRSGSSLIENLDGWVSRADALGIMIEKGILKEEELSSLSSNDLVGGLTWSELGYYLAVRGSKIILCDDSVLLDTSNSDYGGNIAISTPISELTNPLKVEEVLNLSQYFSGDFGTYLESIRRRVRYVPLPLAWGYESLKSVEGGVGSFFQYVSRRELANLVNKYSLG